MHFKLNTYINLLKRKEHNRANFISNMYIVHSLKHWHIRHITQVIKAGKKRRKSCDNSMWQVEVITFKVTFELKYIIYT